MQFRNVTNCEGAGTGAEQNKKYAKVKPRIPILTLEAELRYDKEKYREMILDGAQSVLGYFGFDRTVYGDRRNTTPTKWRWLQESKQTKRKRYQN